MTAADESLKPVVRPSLRPVLQSIFTARITGAGPTIMSSVSVTTDTDTGTIYWVITTSATPPSVAAIKAGTGVVAGTIAISSAGTKAVTFNQPPAGTYYPHMVQTNTGIDSDVHTGTEDTVV